nr:hypothetical protein HK105_002009 [Polyrhizophydium stewartii]
MGTGAADPLAMRVSWRADSPDTVDAVSSSGARLTMATLAAILRKQRQPVTAIDMALTPTLADTTPREIVAIHMAIGIAGDGLEMEKIEKAVALAEHHCPVHKTLSAAVRITRSITLRQA